MTVKKVMTVSSLTRYNRRPSVLTVPPTVLRTPLPLCRRILSRRPVECRVSPVSITPRLLTLPPTSRPRLRAVIPLPPLTRLRTDVMPLVMPIGAAIELTIVWPSLRPMSKALVRLPPKVLVSWWKNFSWAPNILIAAPPVLRARGVPERISTELPFAPRPPIPPRRQPRAGSFVTILDSRPRPSRLLPSREETASLVVFSPRTHLCEVLPTVPTSPAPSHIRSTVRTTTTVTVSHLRVIPRGTPPPRTRNCPKRRADRHSV